MREIQELDLAFGPTFEYEMKEGAVRQVVDDLPELAMLAKNLKRIAPVAIPAVLPNLNPINLPRLSVSLTPTLGLVGGRGAPLVAPVTPTGGAKGAPAAGGKGGPTAGAKPAPTATTDGGVGRGAGGGTTGGGVGGGKGGEEKVVPKEEGPKYPAVTLVFFIGGVTYTEIAALRYLSKKGISIGNSLVPTNSSLLSFFLVTENVGPTKYVIATTRIINGDTLLNTIVG